MQHSLDGECITVLHPDRDQQALVHEHNDPCWRDSQRLVAMPSRHAKFHESEQMFCSSLFPLLTSDVALLFAWPVQCLCSASVRPQNRRANPKTYSIGSNGLSSS